MPIPEAAIPDLAEAVQGAFRSGGLIAVTPPRTLARLLGHANIRITMQFYNRVADANERAAGEAMDRLFKGTKRKRDTGASHLRWHGGSRVSLFPPRECHWSWGTATVTGVLI